jgi:hypothetical protein
MTTTMMMMIVMMMMRRRRRRRRRSTSSSARQRSCTSRRRGTVAAAERLQRASSTVMPSKGHETPHRSPCHSPMHLGHPDGFDMVHRRRLRSIVNDDDAVRAAIVARRDGAKSLLACSHTASQSVRRRHEHHPVFVCEVAPTPRATAAPPRRRSAHAPAVSQICSFTILPSMLYVHTLKSTPIVEMYVGSNVASAKRPTSALLPTAASPTTSTLNRKSYDAPMRGSAGNQHAAP